MLMAVVRISVVACVLAAGPASLIVAFAQTQGTLVSRSELVLIPVVAADDRGVPVLDLTKEDFTVMDNGHSQSVVSFDVPTTAVTAAIVTRAVPADHVWINSDQPSPQHLTIIALDPQNTPPNDMRSAIEAVRRFLLSGLHDSNPIALVVFEQGTIRVVHTFSADANALRHSLDTVQLPKDMLYTAAIDTSTMPSGDPVSARVKATVDNMQLSTQRQVEDSLANMTSDSMLVVARTFASFTGQKTLIWVSGGFKYRQFRPVAAGALASTSAAAGIDTERWSRTFRALNATGISVFAVDVRGLATYELGKRELVVQDADNDEKQTQSQKLAKAVSRANDERAQIADSYQWVASETGGTVFENANDIDRGIKNAYALSGSAYLLTIRPPRNRASRGWHKLEVKVNRRNIHLLTRRGYDTSKFAELTKSQVDISTFLKSPFAQTDFPLAVTWTVVKPGLETSRDIAFTVMLPPGVGADDDGKFAVSVYALAFDSNETQVGSFHRDLEMRLDADGRRKLSESGFRYSGKIQMPAGYYRVHVAVREATTGRTASVWSEVSAP